MIGDDIASDESNLEVLHEHYVDTFAQIVVRYFRSVIDVEGQYTHLRSLEQLLSAQFGGSAFTREGKSYMIRSLLFSKWTWFIYTIAFPLLLVVVLAVNLGAELSRAAALSRPLLVFDALVFLGIITSVALYLAHHVSGANSGVNGPRR